MRYHIKQQQSYLQKYEQLRKHFIFFINEELIFFETNPTQKDIGWQTFTSVKYHRNLLSQINLRLHIDIDFYLLL